MNKQRNNLYIGDIKLNHKPANSRPSSGYSTPHSSHSGRSSVSFPTRKHKNQSQYQNYLLLSLGVSFIYLCYSLVITILSMTIIVFFSACAMIGTLGFLFSLYARA